MNDSYNLESAPELYQFSMDCEEACNCCPQKNTWNPIDIDDRNEISPHEVFMYWKDCDTLWISGYQVELTDKAKQTFNRYVVQPNFADEDNSHYDEGEQLEDNVIDMKTFKILSKNLLQII